MSTRQPGSVPSRAAFPLEHKKPRMWCADPWQMKIAGIGTASNQEMFGALLIILASEVCRDKSSEEEVWPAVTAVLEKEKHSFPVLFDANRQPARFTRRLRQKVPVDSTCATSLTVRGGRSS